MPRNTTLLPTHGIGKGGVWSDFEEPGYIRGPGDEGVFFGVSPSWTPKDEAATGFTCKRCGGKGLVFDATNPDGPISIPFRFDADRHVIVLFDDDPLAKGRKTCIGCLRSSSDDWLNTRVDRNSGPVEVAIGEGGSIPVSVQRALN